MSEYLKATLFFAGVFFLINTTSFRYLLPDSWWKEKDKPLDRRAKPDNLQIKSPGKTLNDVKAAEIVSNDNLAAHVSFQGINENGSIDRQYLVGNYRLNHNW
jgi:hypothetical protein